MMALRPNCFGLAGRRKLADHKSYRVSVKGVLIRNKRVLLLQKHNRIWDLPGGRIEDGETAERCLVRELQEETGLEAVAMKYAGTWFRERRGNPHVFTLVFRCRVAGKPRSLRPRSLKLSNEHTDAAFFDAASIPDLKMVEYCRDAVLDQLHAAK